MTGEWPRESAKRSAGIPLGPATPKKRMALGEVVLLAMTPILKTVEECEGLPESEENYPDCWMLWDSRPLYQCRFWSLEWTASKCAAL